MVKYPIVDSGGSTSPNEDVILDVHARINVKAKMKYRRTNVTALFVFAIYKKNRSFSKRIKTALV